MLCCVSSNYFKPNWDLRWCNNGLLNQGEDLKKAQRDVSKMLWPSCHPAKIPNNIAYGFRGVEKLNWPELAIFGIKNSGLLITGPNRAIQCPTGAQSARGAYKFNACCAWNMRSKPTKRMMGGRSKSEGTLITGWLEIQSRQIWDLSTPPSSS